MTKGLPLAETAQSSPEAAALSNSDRLLEHLKPDSLAARLVQVHKDAGDPMEGLKNTLMERLEQVRRKLGGAED